MLNKGIRKDAIFQLRNFVNGCIPEIVENFAELNGYDAEELKQISFNSYINDGSKGKWKPNHTFTKMFDVEVAKVMSKEKLDFYHLGVLTYLSTFLDHESCVLRIHKNKYMSQKDMSKLLDVDERKINRILAKFIKNGLMYKEKNPEDGRKSIYFINPKLFYKGSEIYTDDVDRFN